jgi:hypothetical protein
MKTKSKPMHPNNNEFEKAFNCTLFLERGKRWEWGGCCWQRKM